MNRPPFRLHDADTDGLILTEPLRDADAARKCAAELIEAGKYSSIAIYSLETGLFGREYYRVETLPKYSGP